MPWLWGRVIALKVGSVRQLDVTNQSCLAMNLSNLPN